VTAPPTRLLRRLTAATALAALAATGCSSVVPPREDMNRLLHELADEWKAKDADALLGHYAADFRTVDSLGEAAAVSEEADVTVATAVGELDRAGFRAYVERRFGALADVTKAKFVLDGIRELEDGAWEVDSLFLLYANAMGGDLVAEQTNWRFEFVPGAGEGEWLIRDQRVVDRTVTRAPAPAFVERSPGETGLDFVHRPHTEIDDSTPVIPGNFSGAGAAVGDVDGDGWLDLLVGDGADSRLYRNRGDGSFEDVTEAAGLAGIDKVRGVYLVDVDDDGRLDAFFTRVKKAPVLYRNAGDLRFADASDALPDDLPPAQYESAAFADLDDDGDLDLFLVVYGDFDELSWAFPIYNAEDGVPDIVLRNDGGRFVRVEDPTLTPPGWGLACAIADYDDDGDQDVYIVNDFGVNHLLRNDGGWRFTEVTEEAGVADQGLGMSAAFGDYDNDGDLDIYVANMNSNSRWVFADPDFPLPAIADLFLRDFVRDEMHKVTRGNTLLQNRGDGSFVQVAADAGVERAEWAWGANFVDFDNDGDLDIYCPNGFITGPEAPDV